MIELIKLEYKKIIRKRLNIVITIATLILTGILFYLPIKSEIVLRKDGSQVSGKEVFTLAKEHANEIAGEITEDRANSDIKGYQNLFKNPNNVRKEKDGTLVLTDEATIKYLLPYYDYYMLLNDVYVDPNLTDSSLSKIQKLDIQNGANLYETRSNKVSTILNHDYQNWGYSDQEKQFWTEKNSEVNEPFNYGYTGAWDIFLSCVELLMLPILTICVCLGSVFSGEYQTGADSLILTSKYGKSKLISAKIIASISFAIIIFTINVILALGIQIAHAGADGWNLPIQILNMTNPYKLNLLSASMTCILIGYLILIGMTSITLLLSAKFKNPYTTLVLVVVIILLPVFFQLSQVNGLYNHILYLMPYRAMQQVYTQDYTSYISYSILGLTLDIITVRIITYILVTFACIPFIKRIFKNHQVC